MLSLIINSNKIFIIASQFQRRDGQKLFIKRDNNQIENMARKWETVNRKIHLSNGKKIFLIILIIAGLRCLFYNYSIITDYERCRLATDNLAINIIKKTNSDASCNRTI